MTFRATENCEATIETHLDNAGATLVVAKLDRLSRNVPFLAALQESGVKVVRADMPEATELTLHSLAAVAQHERKMITQRIRAAMAAAKAKGRVFGNPNGARSHCTDLADGMALFPASVFVAELNRQNATPQ